MRDSNPRQSVVELHQTGGQLIIDGTFNPSSNNHSNFEHLAWTIGTAKETTWREVLISVDGVEYMKRLCIYSRAPSHDYCDEWSVDNAVGIDCYCHKDGCNSAEQNK